MHFSTICLKPSFFAKSWLHANRQQRFQIFHPTISLSHKNFLFGKIFMTSFHVICGLGLPQQKILGMPINWRSPEKNFWRLFFLENACTCVLGPWPRALLSLTSKGSVLGKAVLGLGFIGMRKYFSGNYVILSPKSSEDQKKRLFIAIWDYIRPEFDGFIRADKPFFVWSSNA